MEPSKTKPTPEWQELAQNTFKTLQPNQYRKDTYKATLDVEGYLDLLFTVANLIKVAIMALDTEGSPSKQIQNPPTNIQNILEIALQLLPYEEAEFLDKTREHLLNQPDITS